MAMAIRPSLMLLVGVTAASALSVRPPPDRTLSVASWNILAPSFASPERYPWAPADVLSWSSRAPRIVSTLASIDADVVCLQEVDIAEWATFSSELGALGYDAVLQDVGGKHPIANAVLYRREALRVVRSESRSRVLISVLEALDGAPGTEPLYLANVHLEAGAEKAAQRFCQLRSLLRRLELQRAVDVAQAVGRPRALAPSADAGGAAIVLAGDFNFDRRSALHALLSTGSLDAPPAFGESAPLLRRGEAPYTNQLLPLTDAYASASPPWGPPLRSTYRNGRLLDHVSSWLNMAPNLCEGVAP